MEQAREEKLNGYHVCGIRPPALSVGQAVGGG